MPSQPSGWPAQLASPPLKVRVKKLPPEPITMKELPEVVRPPENVAALGNTMPEHPLAPQTAPFARVRLPERFSVCAVTLVRVGKTLCDVIESVDHCCTPAEFCKISLYACGPSQIVPNPPESKINGFGFALPELSL